MSGARDRGGREAMDEGEPVIRKLAEPAILAFDIDGTVLGRDDLPVPGIAGVLQELAAAGALLVPCTGRPLHSALLAAGALGVRPDACVAYHGALVVDLRSGERLQHLTVPDELAVRTALAGLADGLQVSLSVDDERLDLPRGWSPGGWRPPAARDQGDSVPGEEAPGGLAAPTTAPACPPGSLRLSSDGVADVTRIVLAGDPRRVTPALPQLVEARRAGMRIEQVRPGVVVVLPAGADKGGGLSLAAAHLGVPLRRVVAAGDDLNDITLLLAAGRAVAVGAAGPALRAVAGVSVEQGDLAAALRDEFVRLG